MSLFHLFVLAVIQGLTEFLPVSSSGHLALLPNLTNLKDQGLAMDVAVHVGTLVAVVLYFWSDVKMALAGMMRLLVGKVDTKGAVLAYCLMIATIPVALFGLIIHLTGLVDQLRSIAVIGWAMLVFGVILYWADTSGDTSKATDDWSTKDAVWMGIAQAIALIPGTSRSGITITAARRLGFDRESAARLAMLMSIPTILASAALLTGEAMVQVNGALIKDAAIAALFACIAALVSLVLMMRLLRSISFTPYVIYRCVLGVILLWIAYT